jgi:hypothetical protein
MAMFRAPPTPPLPPVFRSVQLSTNPVAHFSVLLITAHSPDHGLGSLSPVVSNETLFGSQALLPMVQFWSGRLQLGASESTFHMGNVENDYPNRPYFAATTTSVKSSWKLPLQKLTTSLLIAASNSVALKAMLRLHSSTNLRSPNSCSSEFIASVRPSV